MTQRRSKNGLLAWLSMCACAASAVAQGSQQPASPPASVKAQATAILERMFQAYADVATYQDVIEISTEAVLREPDGEQPETKPRQCALAFARPNHVRIEWGGVLCASDGQAMWTSRDDLGQYLKDPAPQSLQLADLPRELSQQGFAQSHPALLLLTVPRGREMQEVLGDVAAWSAVTRETFDGVACDRIDCRLSPMMYGPNISVPCSLFIDADTHLLRGMQYDMAPARNTWAEQSAVQSDEPPTLYDKLLTTVRVTGASVNQPIDPATFTFTPAEDARLVEAFDWQSSRKRTLQVQMLGKPAPAWTATNLGDGRSVTMGDFAGKVVLLDFWATWCGPCVAAMPHMQALADRFSGKPVAVVGVSVDERDPADKIRRFVEKRKLSYQQVLGKNSKAGEAFAVSGIPHLVLIDQAGVVQDFVTGFDPNGSGEKDLVERIELLLEGKPITRLAERDASLAPDEGDEPSGPGLLPELDRDRLRPSGRQAAHFDRYMHTEFDVDNDGRSDLITRNYEGGIFIITDAGQSVRRLRFEGMRRDAQISSIAPVRDAHGLQWIAASARNTNTGPVQGSAEVGCYDDAGAKSGSTFRHLATICGPT